MQINIHHHHHFPERTHEWRLLSNIHEAVMTLSVEVQRLRDLVKSNTSVVASIDLGMKSLQAQVAELKTQIGAATSMSDEDRSALASAAEELSGSIETLRADIPASTALDKPAAPATPAEPIKAPEPTPSADGAGDPNAPKQDAQTNPTDLS